MEYEQLHLRALESSAEHQPVTVFVEETGETIEVNSAAVINGRLILLAR